MPSSSGNSGFRILLGGAFAMQLGREAGEGGERGWFKSWEVQVQDTWLHIKRISELYWGWIPKP